MNNPTNLHQNKNFSSIETSSVEKAHDKNTLENNILKYNCNKLTLVETLITKWMKTTFHTFVREKKKWNKKVSF